ncbi:ABC transporter substrate-binding protein [Alicyclobacillus sp. SO9]|uniref:ABC transporter substrate-binding protein n=1 Tax=Alicyclobacillus sp. SO9 TaxID=2665646 RepID=UPI0018E7B85F|nr:ABC transporter substrate-binding protein [Alicyclobacillus sp. SO9]QQE79294.1 ABC transporter substrate-binding protein [Alicyclobacillus sp. SO9]
MTKKFFSASLFTVLLVSGVSGCGTAAHGNTSSSRSNSTSGSGSGQSNTLVVYSAGPKSLAVSLVNDFEKKTGIKVQLFKSTTGKVLGRLQAEKSNPKADVVALADWSAGNALKSQGMLLSFHPKNESSLLWKDAGSTYFGYSASALAITYNTKLVKNPPTTWAAATSAKWKGKVVMPDPAQSGSAVDFVGGYLQNHNDSWSFFQNLKKDGAVVQGANSPALNQVITGSKDMVLAGVDYMGYSDIAKGEPLGVVYPKGGTVVNPRPIMILKSSKHVQNAKKFVNFVLSNEGQADVAKKFLLPGVKGVAASPKRKGLSDIKAWSVNWVTLSKNKAGIIKHVDGLLK